AAEKIGDLQNREEGVGGGTGAEQRGDAHVAKEAEQPRQQGRAAHRGDVTRQRHDARSPWSSARAGRSRHAIPAVDGVEYCPFPDPCTSVRGDHDSRDRSPDRDCIDASGRYSAARFSPLGAEGYMAATQYDVLGIGNAIVDVIARTEDDFLVAQKMRKGTMQLIDEAQAAKIYDAMGPAVEGSGGSAANTTVVGARLGAGA